MIPEGTENKVIVIDDVFKSGELDLIKHIIKNTPNLLWKYEDENPLYTKHRVKITPINSLLSGKPFQQIEDSVQNALFSPSRMKYMKTINDFSYKLIDNTDTHKIYLTSHISNKPCGWHKDDSTHDPNVIQTLNYIFHVDAGGEFSGGELDVSYDEIDQSNITWTPKKEPTIHQTIEYKDNRLVVIPAWMWHRVRTTKTNGGVEPLDGRITINGHIGFLRGNSSKVQY